MESVGGRGFPTMHAGDTAPTRQSTLQTLLYNAVCETANRLDALTGIVYLAESEDLYAVMIGGVPPSAFSAPEFIPAASNHASAQAFRTGNVAFVEEPEFSLESELAAGLFSYSVASVPVMTDRRRFGTLTFLFMPHGDGLARAEPQSIWLLARGRKLAQDLELLTASQFSLRGSVRPILFPLRDQSRRPTADLDENGWGLINVPSSSGMTLMHQVRWLARELNKAHTSADATAAAAAHIMVPFRADDMTICVVRNGRLWVVGHQGSDHEAARKMHGSGINEKNPSADVLYGRPLYLQQGDLEAAYSDTLDPAHSSWAYLPLRGSTHRIGVCSLGFREPHRFTPDETSVLMMMADLVGSAFERIRMGESEHELAASLQSRLLPRSLSEQPEASVTARYLPAVTAHSAGGDWYDTFTLSDNRMGFVVGDIEGHSVESAVVMGQVRSAVLAYASEGHEPSAIMDRTSKLLAELDTELLATCCIVFVNASADIATCCLAGHPPPVYRTADGEVRIMDAPPGVPLGLFPAPVPYQSVEIPIDPGCLIFMYTDGIAEGDSAAALNVALQQLGSLDLETIQDLEIKVDQIVQGSFPIPGARRDDAVLLFSRYEGIQPRPHRHIEKMGIQRRDLRGVAKARDFVQSRMTAWGHEAVADDLILIVSELATNALIHADSDVEVRLREYGDRIRMEVRDSDPAPPVPSFLVTSEGENQIAEHGRGIIIVEALASVFGSSPNGRGKTIWLEMALP